MAFPKHLFSQRKNKCLYTNFNINRSPRQFNLQQSERFIERKSRRRADVYQIKIYSQTSSFGRAEKHTTVFFHQEHSRINSEFKSVP